MIIGIDVGGSTTKIVGVKDGEIRNPMFVTAKDPVTSLFGAFGKYIYDHSIQLSEVEQVMLTGVGSSYIQQPLYGLPTARTDEFIANGLSAQYATGSPEAMRVSGLFSYSAVLYEKRSSMPFLSKIEVVRPSFIQKFETVSLRKSLTILGSILRMKRS